MYQILNISGLKALQALQNNPLSNVIDLSKVTFTYNEFKLLNNNFCPTPGKHSKCKYTKDINDFTRRIKLKAHLKLTQPLGKQDAMQFTKSSSKKRGSLKKHSIRNWRLKKKFKKQYLQATSPKMKWILYSN